MIPDKFDYKTTVTKKLRNDIACIVNAYKLKNYIEIGCDVGYTMMSIIDLNTTIESMTGIDIDANRTSAAKENVKRTGFGSFQIITGTSDLIDNNHIFDIALIDAAHDYENVKFDFKRLTERSLLDKIHVVFHDYGLVNAGVKKFVDELSFKKEFVGMSDSWNPKGGLIDDWEAVYVIFER